MPGPGDRGGPKAKPRDAKGALRRILQYLMEYRWWVLLFLACTFLSNIGNLLGPRFAGKAIGVVEDGFKLGQGQVDMEAVKRYALLMLVCYVGGSVMSFLVSIGMMRVGRRVARNMRRDVFNKLMTLPVGYFDRNQAGDIISRVSYDVDVVLPTSFSRYRTVPLSRIRQSDWPSNSTGRRPSFSGLTSKPARLRLRVSSLK